MSEIKIYEFSQSGIEKMRDHRYGSDWPIVYLIKSDRELYVGETVRAYRRAKEHLVDIRRNNLKEILVVSDDEFNMSATKDTESSLIEYLVADGKYVLQNGNSGMQNHEFFDRERYKGKFELLWTKLQDLKIATHDLLQIRNSDIFKYSPYKTLTEDQYAIASNLLEHFKDDKKQTYVIHGGPGTGKTILATYLIKQLVEGGKKDVALVIAMVSLRKTLKKVFRGIPGLSPNMVIGPNEVNNQKYDILVVDETHRLHQRRNIPNYGTFDATNRSFGLGNEGTELDWILHSANQVVLFYDERQSVRPSDISVKKVLESSPISFELKTQMRVKGGEKYLHFIDSLLENEGSIKAEFSNYDFKIYDDLEQMVKDIKGQEKTYTLSRLVAGYAWKWVSKRNPAIPDIVIGNTKLFWNSKIHDWVNSPNAVNEVGCIHTIQGYDLNYTGVIIGPEMSYNPIKKVIEVDRKKYLDSNGHKGVSDPEELKRYVINIYKTLLTRGILGTYVYVVDAELRKYIKSKIGSGAVELIKTAREAESIKSPYVGTFVDVPLFDAVGCGDPMFADPTVQEMHPVPSSMISKGAKYFVLRTSGDSMNLLGISDGDLILCQKNYQASSGSIAVVLIGDEATLKEIHYEKDGLLLKPRSTNSQHKPRKLTEEDEEFKVLGVFIKKISQ